MTLQNQKNIYLLRIQKKKGTKKSTKIHEGNGITQNGPQKRKKYKARFKRRILHASNLIIELNMHRNLIAKLKMKNATFKPGLILFSWPV